MVEKPKRWRPDLWISKGLPGPVDLWVLADAKFDKKALKYLSRTNAGAFSVWADKFWRRDAIYVRTSHLHLIQHEIRHLETKRDFHG